jgi:RND family efflux transporter MFP subunit
VGAGVFRVGDGRSIIAFPREAHAHRLRKIANARPGESFSLSGDASMRAAMLVLVMGLAFPSGSTSADDPQEEREFIGRAQADASVKAGARVSGYVTRIAVDEGDAVQKGDLLAEIDPRPYQLDLDAALGRLKATEARLRAVQSKAAHVQKLHENKVISSDELAVNEAAVAEAEAALIVAKVEAKRAELTLSWTRVVAPFDGHVSHVHACEGGLVVADQTRIVTVVSTDRLRVVFNVPESVLLQLRRDGLTDSEKLDVTVAFIGEEGHPHAATLDVIAPEVDPMTGTVPFRATLPNSDGFFAPGMSVRVRLAPASK